MSEENPLCPCPILKAVQRRLFGSEETVWNADASLTMDEPKLTDPSRPETVTTLVTTILETLQKVLLPSEVPEENSSQPDNVAIPTDYIRRNP